MKNPKMIKPKNPLERFIRKNLAVAIILGRGLFNRKTNEATRSILTNGQSIREKYARIQAELLETASQEFWSDRNLNLLGLGTIDCVCSPRVGHNAPPKPQPPRRRKHRPEEPGRRAGV